MQSEESTMAETAAPEASPAPAIQIAPGMSILGISGGPVGLSTCGKCFGNHVF